MNSFAEYIWLDGSRPVQGIRSKARIVRISNDPSPADFPEWNFDGSSTGQAKGSDSDCTLKPVRVVDCPYRGLGNYIVLCEVLNPDGTPHHSNSRASLRSVLDAVDDGMKPWIGFEQEYTLMRDGRPLGFPENGYPEAQGPYYCGVGSDRIFGRELVEDHARRCVDAGLMFYGINAEVMPGQWEFQIGYRNIDGEDGDALRVSDDLQIARYLLHRATEVHGVIASLDVKPVKGDWNGAGMHTNFSTSATRSKARGMRAIKAAVEALAQRHDFHIQFYGEKLDERLTGDHETCDISTFKSGVAHRGASIRIPQPVALNGYGYIEDRRPGANADPYLVAACLISTVSGTSKETLELAA